MKAFQPMFINARLSVVCAWSNPLPKPVLAPRASQPIVILDERKQKLRELSELEQPSTSIRADAKH